jgi:hypothetical protein
MKEENTESKEQFRVLLRSKSSTQHRLVSMEELDNVPNPVKVAKVREITLLDTTLCTKVCQ